MSQTVYPNILPSNKKKQFELGPSYLDNLNPSSELNRSHLRGFFNMALIFGSVFIFTKPILNKIQNGYFLQPSLYTTFMHDYFLCILIWPLFFLWSYTSFFIQKLILKGLSLRTAKILQLITQLSLFVFSGLIILIKDWCSTHSAFVVIQAATHFMKMHSYTTVNRDYRQNKNQRTIYPQNINIHDFTLFMWTPWIVYDNYPRKSSRSILYIIKKSFFTLASILTAYILHTQYIIPYIQMGNKIGFLQLLLRQMLPGTLLFIIAFYITFQNITNIFAEITKLDYRRFYQDWWNATTYQQFNRMWNRPVHMFLYRHSYLQLIMRGKLNKWQAQIITFMLSAIVHEFLAAILFRIFRPILFGFMVGQIPVIYLTKFMRGTKSGAYLFWFGIFLGHSLVIICYLKVNESVIDLFARK